jgi:hypothetical protein
MENWSVDNPGFTVRVYHPGTVIANEHADNKWFAVFLCERLVPRGTIREAIPLFEALSKQSFWYGAS